MSAITPCVEVALGRAIGGGEVQRWHEVQLDSFLEDVVGEELMDSLPGEVEALHGQKRLERPLHIELQQCMKSSEDRLLLGLVRTQAFKDDDCDLVPYLCTDGTIAARIPELGVRFTFSRVELERVFPCL